MTESKRKIIREIATSYESSAYFVKVTDGVTYIIELLRLGEKTTAIGTYRVYQGTVAFSQLELDQELTKKITMSLGLVFGVDNLECSTFKIFGLPYNLRALREKKSAFVAGYDLDADLNNSITNIASLLVAANWRQA